MTRFKLPSYDIPIEFSRRDGSRTDQTTVIDTILIEPDLNRFTMVWRTSLPLKRNIFELTGIVAGTCYSMVQGPTTRQRLLPLASRNGTCCQGATEMKPVAILASGMMTGVGLNSPATCAAMRANLVRLMKLAS